ncbi:Uncharacterized protein dnm_031810 [Desulfonema magnum]|uniref:Uncharacterized protein n=1 Tax=Desulfonema magnum TaxID=45655 RepID=A0A975BKV3_9BACT|nr:Uncharacterized protein dnm_031810 [Desulfonema magnum]
MILLGCSYDFGFFEFLSPLIFNFNAVRSYFYLSYFLPACKRAGENFEDFANLALCIHGQDIFSSWQLKFL